MLFLYQMPVLKRFYRLLGNQLSQIPLFIEISFSAYDVLDVTEFYHERKNHSKTFVDDRNHINGIENFSSQAKRHMRRFNGIPREHFYLFLKECEWRFNNSDPKFQFFILKQLVRASF